MMKKYWILLVFLTGFFITSCVDDEQPEPVQPEPEKPDYSQIVINELIAKDTTDPYFIDEAGDPTDWVELYNKGNKAIDVGGMFITDKEGNSADWQQIPQTDAAVTTIPPKGFLVLICGAANADGSDVETQIHNGEVFINMGISASKDSVISLFAPDSSPVCRSGNFSADGPEGKLPDDKSFGVIPDGSDNWKILSVKTPGEPNDGTQPVQGTLVINEFMSSNDSWEIPGDNGDQPDWIEIYNTGDTPIDAGGWYVTDDLEVADKYQIPVNQPGLTTVPPHGFLVVICDGTGEGMHTNFKLSSGGEAVGISPDGTTITDGYTYCPSGCDLGAPVTDNSMGRDGDGSENWVEFVMGSDRQPTPGASNN
jgi:hypothetical protein